jgi:hypothetical protein
MVELLHVEAICAHVVQERLTECETCGLDGLFAAFQRPYRQELTIAKHPREDRVHVLEVVIEIE